VLTLTWRDTLYTHKSNAPLGASAVSMMELPRKIKYFGKKVLKNTALCTRDILFIRKRNLDLIVYYYVLRAKYFSYLDFC